MKELKVLEHSLLLKKEYHLIINTLSDNPFYFSSSPFLLIHSLCQGATFKERKEEIAPVKGID